MLAGGHRPGAMATGGDWPGDAEVARAEPAGTTAPGPEAAGIPRVEAAVGSVMRFSATWAAPARPIGLAGPSSADVPQVIRHRTASPLARMRNRRRQ
jgi:hypothetical protein